MAAAALARFAKDGPLFSSGANAVFSIQTIGVDAPTSTPAAVAVALLTATATSTPTAAAAAAIAATTTKAHGSPSDSNNNGECRLLGSFAIFVQLGLGALALLSLVYKRWRERPQRPLKIWSFDVSKQVFGSVLVHIVNVFMSMLTSGRFSIKLDPGAVATGQRLMRRSEDYTPNPCSFYLLNLAIDTTLGIPILIILLRITTALVSYTRFGKPAESIQSGNYGSPPKAWWWFKQSVIYFCGLFGMKICVLIIFVMLPWISRVGDWALGWTEGNEKLQIIFVMMLFPLIMNALQYYIIDSFIKNQTASSDDTALGGGGVNRSEVAYDHLAGGMDDDDDNDDDDLEEGIVDTAAAGKSKLSPGVKDREYDPSLDGDSPTIIGSSSSRRSQAGGNLPKELYPRE